LGHYRFIIIYFIIFWDIIFLGTLFFLAVHLGLELKRERCSAMCHELFGIKNVKMNENNLESNIYFIDTIVLIKSLLSFIEALHICFCAQIFSKLLWFIAA